jgi:hypothetical protein
MKRKINQTRYFSKSLNSLLKKRQILEEDFDDFKEELAKNPEMGDIVSGTSGVRKTRLKSASRGKSGGSRICYYDINHRNEIYLLLIYAKNQQEDLTAEDKKDLKELVNALRKDSR